MTAPRTRRRRAAQRLPRDVVLRAACLVVGLAAVALLASAGLSPREPAHEQPARLPVVQATVAAEVAPTSWPAALPQVGVTPSPTIVRAPPAAADPAPQPAGDPPRPGTERAFYEADLLLAARPGALAERARRLLLGGEGSDPERVAALRALWDSATPGAEEWFAVALRPPPDAPAPNGALSVGEFALGFLQARASREPTALELLVQLASDSGAPRALRRGAAVAVAAEADAPRLRRLATDVAADDAPDFRAALARAAALNDAPEATALFTIGEP